MCMMYDVRLTEFGEVVIADDVRSSVGCLRWFIFVCGFGESRASFEFEGCLFGGYRHGWL